MKWLYNDYVVIGLIILLVLVMVWFSPSSPVRASPVPEPVSVSDNCEEVAVVGLLEVYHCESDYGDFFVNSFGFMVMD